jgi:hypothetical protein
VTNECCWGSLDDAIRTRIVEESLKVFVELGIGFLPHALQESLAEDLHRPEFGPVGTPGFMAFVLMDGSLRRGHDIFNTYAALAQAQAAPGKIAVPDAGSGSSSGATPVLERPDVDPEYF